MLMDHVGLDRIQTEYEIYRESTNGYVLSSPHYQSFKESKKQKNCNWFSYSNLPNFILICHMCLMWLFTKVCHCQSLNFYVKCLILQS